MNSARALVTGATRLNPARIMGRARPTWIAARALVRSRARAGDLAGVFGDAKPDLAALLTHPPRTFGDFARDYAESFRHES